MASYGTSFFTICFHAINQSVKSCCMAKSFFDSQGRGPSNLEVSITNYWPLSYIRWSLNLYIFTWQRKDLELADCLLQQFSSWLSMKGGCNGVFSKEERLDRWNLHRSKKHTQTIEEQLEFHWFELVEGYIYIKLTRLWMWVTNIFQFKTCNTTFL